MGLVKCYKCKHVVNGDTEQCSNCGADFRRKSAFKGVLLLVVIAAVILSAVYWLATLA
jgi:RNA polymerase subunit RPABC4/transcription elongation factor Spt4